MFGEWPKKVRDDIGSLKGLGQAFKASSIAKDLFCKSAPVSTGYLCKGKKGQVPVLSRR